MGLLRNPAEAESGLGCRATHPRDFAVYTWSRSSSEMHVVTRKAMCGLVRVGDVLGVVFGAVIESMLEDILRTWFEQ